MTFCAWCRRHAASAGARGEFARLWIDHDFGRPSRPESEDEVTARARAFGVRFDVVTAAGEVYREWVSRR